MKPTLLLTTLLLAPLAALNAADAPAKAQKPAPEHRKYELPVEPDENVAYGPHRMQVIYFWRAKSDQPTPLLVYIHGGGWQGGDRSVVRSMLLPALEAGISVASVEYRTIKDSIADGLVPPVKGPMLDCARALQFCRSKAKEWNLDKTRVGLAGGSAGACTSLWLAFHDDLADPDSADPIARESTRVTCAAVSGAQTSLDPHQMREWTPNSKYGSHAFGITWDPKQKSRHSNCSMMPGSVSCPGSRNTHPTNWSPRTIRPSVFSIAHRQTSVRKKKIPPTRQTSA